MTTLHWVLLISVVLLLGFGGYLLVRWRNRPQEAEAFHFSCPRCRQRLRYLLKQAGHSGMCPRCKKPLTFPSVAAHLAPRKRS